ncbi:FxsA family protein [Candidatus Pelagibacter sp.]|uniref:FxsA family protein n=1 Tax=Candidatus Pelagibacter sp. TaxID=2024849 RepID=UPI003F8381CD
MNSLLIAIILIPIIEIYLFIEIGGQIGAFNTISLIFITAIIGVIYARYEGLNTLRSGFSQLIKNETPIYEIVSGAAITFAALLLIVPGFATDLFGFLLIFPLTRKLIFGKIINKFKNETKNKKPYIEGEFEDIKEDDERKL